MSKRWLVLTAALAAAAGTAWAQGAPLLEQLQAGAQAPAAPAAPPAAPLKGGGKKQPQRPASRIVTITRDNYDAEVTQASRQKPVLVMYSADWCPACRNIMPVIEALSQMNELKVGKVDIEAQRQLASEKGVCYLPTFYLVRNGTETKVVIVVNQKDDGTVEIGFAPDTRTCQSE